MEIISSEIKNINKLENTFHLVLRISNKKNSNERKENCERKYRERKHKTFGKERLKMIDQKINYLKQKLSEIEENEEKKQRIETKILRLSEKKRRIENKFNSETELQNKEFCEMKRSKRRCNKFSDEPRKYFKHNHQSEDKEDWRKRKEQCIERRINKLKDLLNQQLPQEKKERIQSKLEFLSKKLSQIQQRKDENCETKPEINNTNTEKRERCRSGKFLSKEFVSERIEHLKQRKQRIESKLNEIGNTNQFLREKLSYKLEKIEKRITWINQKLENI